MCNETKTNNELKVGDKVRVIDSEYRGPNLQPGATGTIVRLELEPKGAYAVRMDVGEPDDGFFPGWGFFPDQLEKVES